MVQEIWVYKEKASPRLAYVLKFISSIWGVKFFTTTDADEFSYITTAKINYSHLKMDGLQWKPHSLLFEHQTKKFEFANLENDSLAMIFFLLTRYEEYVIPARDKHNRFEGTSSYLFKTNRLQFPWVDILLDNLKHAITEKYPYLKLKSNQFLKQLTIDIDQAYLYKNKSFKRFIGANLKDATTLKFGQIIKRKLTYFGMTKDPWDIYDDMYSKFKNEHNPPIFFFQVGDYGKFDKNINYQNKGLRKLIQQTETWTSIGLHPSYQSAQDKTKLQHEKKRLEEIVSKKTDKSRQHYIKIDLPSTYQNLIDIGITDDYSMGFTDQLGFRAGTAHSFNWYDLSQEKETTLKIHPFCAMDVSLKNYLKLNPQQALEKLEELSSRIEKYGGTFCVICHNESLSGHGEWQGWNENLLAIFLSDNSKVLA